MAKYDNDVSFYIVNKAYVYYSYRAHDGEAAGATGIKTKPGGGLKSLDKTDKGTIELIKSKVDEYAGDCKRAKKQLLKEDIENLVNELLNKKTRKRSYTIAQLVDLFLKETTGDKPTILTKKKKRYAKNSITGVEKIKSVFARPGFDMGAIYIEQVKQKDFDEFLVQLTVQKSERTKRNLSKNTIACYFNYLLMVIKTMHQYDYHKTDIDTLGVKTEAWEDVDYPIYYTIDELVRLKDFDGLPKGQREVRDVFVCGSFTCLRHSDGNETDYRKAIKGGELHIMTQKRDVPVKIPLHPVAKEILEKYEYKLPKHNTSYFDSTIKKICRKAGFTQECLFSRTEGGVMKTEYRQKCMLTSSHTMRRNFATNAQLNGVPSWAVKKIGGWKSDNSFKKYLRMAEKEANLAAVESKFYKM